MNSKKQNVVEIHINNQTYKVACSAGEEAHIKDLALIINTEVLNLVDNLGQVGENRLLLMASLMIADKLSTLENKKPMNQTYDLLKNVTKRIQLVAEKLSST